MSLLPATVAVSPDVLSQELEGETVVLDLRSERYYVLDDVGTRMWQLLATLGDPAAVCARMLDEYDVDAESLRRDLGALIAKLAEAGMVEVA
jgi:hypothetical protein